MNPKSILRNAPSHRQPSAPDSKQDRNYETALYHANLIQAQKDAECFILTATETLLDFPSSPNADPGHPSPHDATLVKHYLRPFQPSDYDALIEERNIDKKCGYVLCPQPHLLQLTAAKYRLLYGKGKGPDALRVVEKSHLEKWCSDDCGRRALYIKVQLSEEPSWLRRAGPQGDLVLLEGDGDTPMQIIEGMKGLDLGDRKVDVSEKMGALAIERGDGNRPRNLSESMNVDIKENASVGMRTPSAPKPVTNGQTSTNLIEGYEPRHKALNGKSNDSSDDDESRDILDSI